MSTESTQTPEPSPTFTPHNSVINTGTSNSLITINAAAQLPVKLTPLNYPSWRAQFNALLLGYDLLGYIDGTHICPPKPATASPTSPHILWVRQDQLLLHAILASVSEQVISLIATATTSKVAWDKLNQLYASKARSRVMGLKERISLMRRDSKPVSEYLQRVKAIADELALIDVPLSDDDLVIHILNGVGPEFKEISAAVRARDSSISFETLHDKLVEYEAVLKREESATSGSVITANTAQQSRSFNRGPRNNQPNQSRPSHNSGPRYSRDSPTANSSGSNFSSRSYSGGSNVRRSTNFSGTGYRGFCQLCDQQGHSAKRCPRVQVAPHHQPMANPTTSSRTSSSPTWLLDSGASHHVTADPNNLSQQLPYEGPDEIVIGNGKGLHITHVGSTHLSSPSSHNFSLSL